VAEMTTTPLPGIGIRYEFIAQDGYRIGVVHHRARAGVEGLAIDRLPLPADGPYHGRTIGTRA
jgi:hypothetical protein